MVVECGSQRILVDAGFSCREIESRLAKVDIEEPRFDGLVITHEHGDHCKGAARFSRRHSVPIFATEGTLAETGLGQTELDTHVLNSGRAIEIGHFVVEPFAIPHDAREPIGLVVEDPVGRRVGLVADLGSRSQLAWARLTDLDALILEANHDLEMLRSGPYPWPLKQRVAGRHGHLSNREAAAGVAELDTSGLAWVVLYHLSRTNNLPPLALNEVGEELAKQGSPAEICVAGQFEPTPWLEVAREKAASADSQVRI